MLSMLCYACCYVTLLDDADDKTLLLRAMEWQLPQHTTAAKHTTTRTTHNNNTHTQSCMYMYYGFDACMHDICLRRIASRKQKNH
mmetsp:Transcript_9468/g.18185  ORF Transcript_9468/g.18185 Transcript_9468/m.18185 type:complete len:85 (-) Transcript_9468:268-522(-)